MIKGVDISMIRDLEALGAKYYLNNQEADVFKIFKACGINMARFRLWVDPKTVDGIGYGGGGNDLETTISLAKRAKENNLDILLDFHYSDFWADPAKQTKPKGWSNLHGSLLAQMVYKYTSFVLDSFMKENIQLKMIQVGNEITNGFLWPDGHYTNHKEMINLLNMGIKAIREKSPESRIVIHLDSGCNQDLYESWFSACGNLDYDIIGMSFYPHWNGSIKELMANINKLTNQFYKDVIVLETSIGYTLDNYGCDQCVYTLEEAKKTGYEPTQEGQMRFLGELFKSLKTNKRALGAFYWEPAWIPIKECTWATKEGVEYMHDQALPGNTMANQALFDQNGHPNLALLKLNEM